jgi:hypothetical protein
MREVKLLVKLTYLNLTVEEVRLDRSDPLGSITNLTYNTIHPCL